MSYQSLFCYGWDLAEADSLNDLAATFRERGINAITFATAYHAGKFLRPHGQGGKVYFPEDGTAYFKTDATRYGEIKPQENSMVASRDMLRECCELPDIDVTAWMVLLHNSRVAASTGIIACTMLSAIPISIAFALRRQRCVTMRWRFAVMWRKNIRLPG